MPTAERHYRPRPRYALVYSSAIAVAVASGSFALVALLMGSPVAFGLALALCATAWIVTHFVERLVVQARASDRRRRDYPAGRRTALRHRQRTVWAA